MSFYGQQIIQQTNNAPAIQVDGTWIIKNSETEVISHKKISLPEKQSFTVVTLGEDQNTLYRTTIEIDEAGHIVNITTNTTPLNLSGFNFSDDGNGNLIYQTVSANE